MTSAAISVMAADPVRALMRWAVPSTAMPHPSISFPTPVPAYPNITRPRHGGLDVHLRRRRRGININYTAIRSAGFHGTSGGKQTGARQSEHCFKHVYFLHK
jgi:hypothetical protein